MTEALEYASKQLQNAVLRCKELPGTATGDTAYKTAAAWAPIVLALAAAEEYRHKPSMGPR